MWNSWFWRGLKEVNSILPKSVTFPGIGLGDEMKESIYDVNIRAIEKVQGRYDNEKNAVRSYHND